MKYLLKQKIPNTDYEVGHVFETTNADRLRYLSVEKTMYKYIEPHEILLMLKAGILEEVKEKELDKEDCVFILARNYDGTKSIFKVYKDDICNSHEEAQAKLDELIKN